MCVQVHSFNYRDITPVSVKGVIMDFQPSFAETAINIGYSCKLLQEDMEVRCIAGEDSEVIRGELETVIAMHQHSTNRQSSKDSVQSQDVSMVCIRTYVRVYVRTYNQLLCLRLHTILLFICMTLYDAMLQAYIACLMYCLCVYCCFMVHA